MQQLQRAHRTTVLTETSRAVQKSRAGQPIITSNVMETAVDYAVALQLSKANGKVLCLSGLKVRECEDRGAMRACMCAIGWRGYMIYF